MTLGFAVFGSVLFRGFLSVIPILIAVIAGYVAAAIAGIVDFSSCHDRSDLCPAKLFCSKV